jgi:hypothetical protein
MDQKRYWFPVRPARNGWGWGLPIVWQGWVALLALFALLIGGMIVVAPHGQLATIAYGCCMPVLFLGLFWWKGEPQSMRDESSP